MTQLINDEAVYGTALATPGLLITVSPKNGERFRIGRVTPSPTLGGGGETKRERRGEGWSQKKMWCDTV